ncbi:YveK family protein [Cohnella sp. 56]|uniref:YveK family protein n=1 Tax=Cohnella sp. 56 TaxID=3113722 RepID=UPI0030E7F9C6
MGLKEYLQVIRKRWWLVALVIVVITVLAGIKGYLLTTSLYEANAKVIVNQTSQANGAATVNYSDVQTNIMLINSYKEIIRSSAILNKVAEQYPDFNVTPAEMAGKISVTAANQSQVMNISYVDTSYKNAAKIVNAITNVFKQQIPSIMKVDNITVLNEANSEAAGSPINTNPVFTIIIGFVLSILLSLGLVFLLDYFDHTFKSGEELESELALPILASIAEIRKSDRKRQKLSKKQKVGEGTYATPVN